MCRDIWDSAWRAWVSSVLHMGDWDLCGTRAGFCWNDGIFWRSSYAGIGLPCAMRGVCAHGSRIVAATDVAVPHDYAVPTDTEHPRVCNTHHPRGHTRTPAEPARNGPARPIRSPLPRITPPGTTTPETLTPVSDVMTHHNRAPVVPPISSRKRTDLDTGYDRSRGGSGPISARNATDLEPSPPTHPHKVEGAPIRQSRG